MTEDRPFIAETTFRVRFAETDMMGIVHHSVYLVYFEEGRSEYSRQAGASYADLEARGFSLAVTGVEVRYLAPARYDERLTIRVWAEKLRSRGVTFAYEIINPETQAVLVTGKTHHICIDHNSQVRRIPEDWLNAMRSPASS